MPNNPGSSRCVGLLFFGANTIWIRSRDRRSDYVWSNSRRADQARRSRFEAARQRYVRGGKREARGRIIHHRRSGTVSDFAHARALHCFHEWQETQNRLLWPVRCWCCGWPEDKGPVGVRHGNSVNPLGTPREPQCPESPAPPGEDR